MFTVLICKSDNRESTFCIADCVFIFWELMRRHLAPVVGNIIEVSYVFLKMP